MTREEMRIQTIAQLERISGMLGSIGEEKDWTEYAIRALEQEPVLDKIRAEIEKLRPNLRPEQMTDYDYAMMDVINDIVAIIDKYKAESEE